MSFTTSHSSGSSVFVPLVQTGPDGYGGVSEVGGGGAVGVRGGDGLAVAGVVVGKVWGFDYGWWLKFQQRVVSVAYGVVYALLCTVVATLALQLCAVVYPVEPTRMRLDHVVVSLVTLSCVSFVGVVDLVVFLVASILGVNGAAFGLSHFTVFLTLHEVVGRRPALQRAVLNAGIGETLGILLYYFLCFVGVIFCGHGVLWVCYSAGLGVVSAWLGYPLLVRMVHGKHGEFGVVVMVVIHSLFSIFGILGVTLSRVLLSRLRVDTCGIVEDGGFPDKGVSSCSGRVTDMTRVLSLDLTHLGEVLPEADLSLIGTGAQGACERMEVRRLALVGDRCMSLAVAERADREGWSVGNASDVSQALVTNAAFATWFDKKLVSLFPQMLGRAEKRKGTLVECLVGIAWKTGSTTSDIEAFVFDNVAGALGRRYDMRGECIFLL